VSKQAPSDAPVQPREELREEVAMAVGAFRTATTIVDEAVARAFGINRTDLRVIQTLAVEGQLPAGQLASTVGLSPAATTTAVDRLITAGHVTRSRSERDGRQRLIALTPRAVAIGEQVYGVMVAAGRAVLDRYSRDELVLIGDFMQRARQVEMSHVENLAAHPPSMTD
jgi:DNA-binding MarR family transcriptional regulator